ncbi:N-acetylglucosaminidase [Rossellomorea aquimaris]|uniref:N-acetylglucosaminidase n=1 Tax=Rossellomorea aquimaris TaxID=189382 RepID=UPI001CD2A2E5|nr:N-acetylglucosaminidase [Rossellomorea aquimaris]MCA1055169.1 N-acetylglucosaminidase [Rossellomorea aquimaris]
MYFWFKRKRKRFLRSLTWLMILMLMLPAMTYAATDEETNLRETEKFVEESNQLIKIQVRNELALENGINLTEGQNLFVYQNGEEYSIQVGLSTYVIPKASIMATEATTEEAVFYVDEATEQVIIKAEAKLYETNKFEKIIGTAIEEVSYPVFGENADYYVILIGNKKAYVKKIDILIKKETADISETVTDDEPEGNTQDKNTPSEFTIEEAEVIKKVNETTEEVKQQDLTTELQSVEINESLKTTEQAKVEKSSKTLSLKTYTLTFDQAGYFTPKGGVVSLYDNSTGELVKVGELANNQSYRFIEDAGNWIKVKMGQSYGYVLKEATIPSTGENVFNISSGENSELFKAYGTTNLTVYDNSSGSLVRMGTILKGVPLSIVSEEGSWLKIDFLGRKGYIYKPSTKRDYIESDKFFKINSEQYLSVYDNSTGKLRNVGALQPKQVYPIEDFYGNWIKIKFGNGYGFVWQASTSPVSSHEIQNINNNLMNSNRSFLTQGYVSVYDNTSGSLVKFGSIDPNIKYPIIDQTGNWYKIDFSGRVGYVYAPAVKLDFSPKDKYFKVSTAQLTVYDNSTGNLVKVGELQVGQEYPIEEYYGNWLKIKFGEGYGFVWKDSTSPVLENSINNLSGNTNNGRIVRAKETITVYDNSSGNLVKFGSIYPDVSYPIINQVGNWYKISFAGRVGYIYEPSTRMDFVSTDKYFKVIPKQLALYDNSTGKLVKIGELPKNEEYLIEEYYGNWLKIKVGNGFGFVWKESTKPVLSPSIKNLNTELNGTREAKSDSTMSVYDNTSGSLVKFATLEPRVGVKVIDKVGDWYRVDIGSRLGYIYGPAVTSIEFLPSDDFFEITNSVSNVYSSPDLNAGKMAELIQGQTFEIVDSRNDWHKIQYGSSYGYILKKETTIGNKAKFIPAVNPTQSDNTFVAIQNLPVYDNSTGSLIKFASIEKGETYPFVSTKGNWIEIVIGGRTGYVYKTGVQIGPIVRNSYSEYTFDTALHFQLDRAAPLYDTTKYKAYVHSDAFGQIKDGYGYVFEDGWNVRGGPSTDCWKLNARTYTNVENPPLRNGEKVQILGEQVTKVDGKYEKWYQINYYRTFMPNGNGGYNTAYRPWVYASENDVSYFMNPVNFVNDEHSRFQFLLLSESAGVQGEKLNNEMLTNRGNLTGKGNAFVEAGKLHGINEIYLVSHAIHETGAGTSLESTLLKGYKVNKVDGNPVPERTVYNVYGIAAIDTCEGSPSICAAEFAYKQEWFSVEQAIIGGAKFIGEKYIYRKDNAQNTLYKMRWNPQIPASHQYATDIGWAEKQAVNYFSVYYQRLGLKPKTFDVPVYQ